MMVSRFLRPLRYLSFVSSLAILGACHAPPVQKTVHMASGAIPVLKNDGAVIQELCDGHSDPQQWDGELSFVAKMDVYALEGGLLSGKHRILTAAFPVGHGLTVTGALDRKGDNPLVHEAVCHGAVMQSLYHYEHDRPFVDWVVTMAPYEVQPDKGTPFSPQSWNASGRISIDVQTGKGSGSFMWSPGPGQTISGSSSLMTEITITPGPQWTREYNEVRNKEFEAAHSAKAIGGASALPDEEPGRTLDEDMKSSQ